jgi:hypothetical protein
MRKLTIRKSDTHPDLWTFIDSHRPTEFVKWKKATLYYFDRLRALKTFADVWGQINGNMDVVIEGQDDSMLLCSDADWAIALLKYGP